MSAREAYYIPPGHRFGALEDVEFSPKEEPDKTFEVVGKYIEAMKGISC